MSKTVDFTILRGCDYRVRMRLAQPVNLTELGAVYADWTMVFELRASKGGNTVLSTSGSVSFISRADELGIFDFTLSASNTANLSKATYYYAVRRTDAEYVDVFARGTVNVESF